jgi:hypothetical protein
MSPEQLEEVIEATVRLQIPDLPPLVAKRPYS